MWTESAEHAYIEKLKEVSPETAPCKFMETDPNFQFSFHDDIADYAERYNQELKARRNNISFLISLYGYNRWWLEGNGTHVVFAAKQLCGTQFPDWVVPEILERVASYVSLMNKCNLRILNTNYNYISGMFRVTMTLALE